MAQPLPVRLRFHGVRGSAPSPVEAVPGVGGHTPSVEIEHRDGRRLVLDGGSGLARVRPPAPGEVLPILLTHLHWDHVQGLPHFEGFFRAGARIVLGVPDGGDDHPDAEALLHRLLDPAHFPVPRGRLAAEVRGLRLQEGPLEVEGWRVRALRVRHPSPTLGFRVETGAGDICYIPDQELGGGHYPGDDGGAWRTRLVEFVEGARVLVHDAMYTPEECRQREGWGHSSPEEALALAREARVERLVLFHHPPEAGIGELEARLRGLPSRSRTGVEVELAREEGALAVERALVVEAASGSGTSGAVGDALMEVATGLTAERDPDRLLHRVLDHALELTRADAGSLYLDPALDRNPTGARGSGEGQAAEPESGFGFKDGAPERLVFRLARNRSLPDLDLPGVEIPVDRRSIAGTVALDRAVVRVDDVRTPPAGVSWRFNPSFDEAHGFTTRSVLAVPMANRDGQVVGVLQLLNRRPPEGAEDQDPIPFDEGDARLARALAGQAAVAIENAVLLRDIAALFEGFTRSMVAAIDQRDPATSGHSARVSDLLCALAREVSSSEDPAFRDVHFDEGQLQALRYAGLLHDVGKVGVPEALLLKPRKLPPVLRARVDARLEVLELRIENAALRGEIEDAAPLQERLHGLRELVERADRPRPLSAADDQALAELARGDGAILRTQLLEPEEIEYLRIPRGSLSEEERRVVEAHATHSWRFLQEIPWPAEMAIIPGLAHVHHEKLDGSGYPRGVTAASLALPARLLAVVDIFDALTAMDRTYRDALSPEEALDILRKEAAAGQLDSRVVELLAQTRAYERTSESPSLPGDP